jgi:cytoskeletal protein CcmA (bactofilin family)
MSDPKAKKTIVDEGTELSGTIRSQVPIVVLGKIDGDVSGPSITVAPGGMLAGKIKVKELTSEGEVAGEIEADSVKISGRVRDKTVIKAKSLQVSLASEKSMQVVFGEVELAVGDPPDKPAFPATRPTNGSSSSRA